MRILIEQVRMEVENMDKFQKRLLLIMMSLIIIFSLVLIGFGTIFYQNFNQSATCVLSGLFLFMMSGTFVSDLLGVSKGWVEKND